MEDKRVRWRNTITVLALHRDEFLSSTMAAELRRIYGNSLYEAMRMFGQIRDDDGDDARAGAAIAR